MVNHSWVSLLSTWHIYDAFVLQSITNIYPLILPPLTQLNMHFLLSRNETDHKNPSVNKLKHLLIMILSVVVAITCSQNMDMLNEFRNAFI